MAVLGAPVAALFASVFALICTHHWSFVPCRALSSFRLFLDTSLMLIRISCLIPLTSLLSYVIDQRLLSAERLQHDLGQRRLWRMVGIRFSQRACTTRAVQGQ